MRRLFGILFSLSFVLVSDLVFGQEDICYTDASGVYWPINLPGKRYYYSKDGQKISFFNGDSLVTKGRVYYKEIVEYKNGTKEETYYREENGNVYVYDVEKKMEYLELSGNIIPGTSWEKYDKSWKYTVVDTTSKLSTAYCEFKQLLNIRAEPLGEAKQKYAAYFNLYYKRGVGLVGLNIEGQGYSFLSIDESSSNVRSGVVSGCEGLESEEQRRTCSQQKIAEFISKNFCFSGKIKKGTIYFRLMITEKGQVENISVHRSIKDAEGQTEEARRLINLLEFYPKTINGRPIRSLIIIPVSF